MDEFSLVQKIIIWALPVILAITVHEVAHGWAALQLGDRTAQMMGRLTLNPIKHADLLGTIALPAAMMAIFGVLFGWAKPVPITYQNLRNPKSDMVWVALAGPVANLTMAGLWCIAIKLGSMLVASDIDIGYLIVYTAVAGVWINTMMMIFNLLPLPPLDGGRVLVSFLPEPLAWKVEKIEPYGIFIILALLCLGLGESVILPMIEFFLNLLTALFYLPEKIFEIIYK